MKFKSLSHTLAAAGVVLLSLTCAALGQGSSDTQAKSKLAIQKLEHSFGEIKKGAVAQHTFTFKNEGQANLEIKSVAPS